MNLKTAVSPQRHREHRVKTTVSPGLLAHPTGGGRHVYKLFMFGFSLCLCVSVSLW